MNINKILSTVILVFLLISLASCSGKQNVESISKIGDGKGIVVGKIVLRVNGKDVTNMGIIVFDGSSVGTVVEKLDPGAHFAFSFSPGRHSITGVRYYEGYPTLPLQNEGVINYQFNVNPDKINYIGTIIFDWKMEESILASKGNGIDPLIGGIFSRPKYSEYMGKNVGEISVSFQYEHDDIKRYLKGKYGSDVEVVEIALEGAGRVKAGDTVASDSKSDSGHGSASSQNQGNNQPSGQTREKEYSDQDAKLQKIKEMYDKGLITKEEYDQERKEVLDSI